MRLIISVIALYVSACIVAPVSACELMDDKALGNISANPRPNGSSCLPGTETFSLCKLYAYVSNRQRAFEQAYKEELKVDPHLVLAFMLSITVNNEKVQKCSLLKPLPPTSLVKKICDALMSGDPLGVEDSIAYVPFVFTPDRISDSRGISY